MMKRIFFTTRYTPIKSILLICLISSLPSLVSAKEKVYLATIKGDVMLSIKKDIAKQYHDGDSLNLHPDTLICHQFGDGKVTIKFGKRFTEILSKGDCLPIAKQTNGGGFLAGIWDSLKNKGETIADGSGGRWLGGGKDATKNKKTNKKLKLQKKEKEWDGVISFKPYVVNNKKYLFIKRRAHLNNRYLPVSLELITDKENKTLRQYFIPGDGGVHFMIPWQDIEDKNKPMESYPLTITNKRGTPIMKQTRFRIEASVNNKTTN